MASAFQSSSRFKIWSPERVTPALKRSEIINAAPAVLPENTVIVIAFLPEADSLKSSNINFPAVLLKKCYFIGFKPGRKIP